VQALRAVLHHEDGQAQRVELGGGGGGEVLGRGQTLVEERQGEAEGRASAGLALDGDGPAEQLGQPARKGQALSKERRCVMTDAPKPLPEKPDLEWLRKHAKARLDELLATQPDAQLSDAQFALAQEYGFSSWRALKAHVDAKTLEGQLLKAIADDDLTAFTAMIDDDEPVAERIEHILSALDSIVVMANDPEQRHEIIAQQIRLGQVLSRIELILSFVELQRPYKFRSRL